MSCGYFTCEYVIVLRLAFHMVGLARRWSKSVLGSVAQPDTCGVEPLQAVALAVFRCQLNSKLGHAWQNIL